MKIFLSTLYLLAYFGGVYALIWYHVIVLKEGDPKFATAVDIYYPLWTGFYLLPAVAGLVTALKMSISAKGRFLVAGAFVAAILFAMHFSFSADAHWTVVLLEYGAFALIYGLALVLSLRRSRNRSTIVAAR